MREQAAGPCRLPLSTARTRVPPSTAAAYQLLVLFYYSSTTLLLLFHYSCYYSCHYSYLLFVLLLFSLFSLSLFSHPRASTSTLTPLPLFCQGIYILLLFCISRTQLSTLLLIIFFSFSLGISSPRRILNLFFWSCLFPISPIISHFLAASLFDPKTPLYASNLSPAQSTLS